MPTIPTRPNTSSRDRGRRPGQRGAKPSVGSASGAIARKLLAEQAQIEIVAYVKQVQNLGATVDASQVTRKDVDANIVRCPDAAVADQMIALIDQARTDGDSLGGVIEAVARHVPAGLGGRCSTSCTPTSRQGPAVHPGLQRLRGGQRLRRHAPARLRAQRYLLR